MKERLPGREVRAFGSQGTGWAKPHSDLDLVLMDGRPLPDAVWAELVADLDDSDLPFRIDLLRWPELPPALRATVESTSVSISQ